MLLVVNLIVGIKQTQVLLLLLLVILLLPPSSLGFRQFTDEYPGVTVCGSTLSEHYEHMMPASYMHLKAHLGGLHNCTHIEGNLVIQNVWQNSNETDFSFLESIVEISGMVYMRNNSITKVILPNLRVIRGEKSTEVHLSGNVHQVSLYVELLNETVSSFAIFPNLRVISQHSVYFFSKDSHRYLPQALDWKQLFDNPESQQLLNRNPISKIGKCNSSCGTSATKLRNNCWSSSSDHCQRKTKCEKLAKDCQWCYYWKYENMTAENCCNSQCSGGCTSNKGSQCLVCKNYIDNRTCVEVCPPQITIVRGQKKIIPKLKIGNMCSISCPKNWLQQEEYCVYKCNNPQYSRVGDKCLPCSDDQSRCNTTDGLECELEKYYNNSNQLSFFITKDILKTLTNCTHIVGEFHFTEKSFNRLEGGITLSMLYEHLGKVQYVIGDLLIESSNIDMYNLTFLVNLREIRYYQTNSATAALSIISTNLEFLGLQRLRHIYGHFEEHNNSNLCYLETLPWTTHIIKSNKFNPFYKSCNVTKTCDIQCGALGCWGPSSRMCYQCFDVRAGSNCVTHCTIEPGFYSSNTSQNLTSFEYDNGSCKRCHGFCLKNCTGPSSDNCIGGCRYLTENNTCVDKCSIGYFPARDKVCYKCNNMCMKENKEVHPLCSGNNTIVGNGGCYYCTHLIKLEPINFHCYNETSKCPDNFYLDNVPSQEINKKYFNFLIPICYPCLKPCSRCSRNSTNFSDCIYCDSYWSEDKCSYQCDSKKMLINQTLSANDTCPYCDKQCRTGCFKPFNNSACKNCLEKRFYYSDNIKEFRCVEHCPSSHSYAYKEDISLNLICVNKSQWQTYNEKKYYSFIKNLLLLVLGISIFITVLIVFAIVRYICKSRKRKSINYLKLIYSNIQEPDSRVLLLNKKSLPNMNRLLLIPTNNLIFDIRDKPLGIGAFGSVYQGIWKCSSSTHSRKDVNTLDVAIKVIQSNRDILINDILEEAKVMASVSHKHCLRLIGVCLKYEMPCLVTTFVKLGSLDKYLRKHKSNLSSYILISWAEQIANGMAYLEMRNIIHRDLATRNVLLNDLQIVQITDFGLSRILQDTGTDNNEIIITSGQVPIRWLALETLTDGIYSHKTDVWAYGVTLWEIFSYGHRPYDDLEAREILTFLQQNNRLVQPEICSIDLYTLMTKCWWEISEDRPSFDELMTTLFDYSLYSTYYLNIANDPCLTSFRHGKQRLSSQCSYEMNQYSKSKSVYKQVSMDETISTFIGDYQDDIGEPSIRRQSSIVSANSSKYRFCGDIGKRVLRHHSILSEDQEENEMNLESDKMYQSDPEYLEPIKK